MPQPALPEHLLALVWLAVVVCAGRASGRVSGPTEKESQWEPSGQLSWMLRDGRKRCVAGAALSFSPVFLKQENKDILVESHVSGTCGGERAAPSSARGSRHLWGSLQQAGCICPREVVQMQKGFYT